MFVCLTTLAGKKACLGKHAFIRLQFDNLQPMLFQALFSVVLKNHGCCVHHFYTTFLPFGKKMGLKSISMVCCLQELNFHSKQPHVGFFVVVYAPMSSFEFAPESIFSGCHFELFLPSLYLPMFLFSYHRFWEVVL